MAKQYKPVVLVVMDGVGVNIKNPESNSAGGRVSNGTRKKIPHIIARCAIIPCKIRKSKFRSQHGSTRVTQL